jgi:hypothetical protein
MGWQIEATQARIVLDREMGLLWGLTRRNKSARKSPDSH